MQKLHLKDKRETLKSFNHPLFWWFQLPCHWKRFTLLIPTLILPGVCKHLYSIFFLYLCHSVISNKSNKYRSISSPIRAIKQIHLFGWKPYLFNKSDIWYVHLLIFSKLNLISYSLRWSIALQRHVWIILVLLYHLPWWLHPNGW